MSHLAVIVFIIFAWVWYSVPIANTHTAIYIRHGMRPNLSSTAVALDWQASPRYKTNPRDPPLTSVGRRESYVTGYRLHDYTDTMQHRHIYSSPLTRCMETAVCVCRGIFDRTGHRLTIRVKYALSEGMLSTCRSVYATTIDTPLYPDALAQKYGAYLDHTYCPDTKYIKKRSISGYCRAVCRILQDRHSLIIGHGGHMLALYRVILTSNLRHIVNCPLNAVTIHEGKKEWQLTHPTARIIAGSSPSESDRLADTL